MKKPYSLDYTIERDTDRLKLVEGILDTLDHDPSETDIEQMATYILYGKDENGLSSLTDEQEFRSAYKRDVYKKSTPTIKRPKYDKKTGELIDIGDADIPGMVELWERLDHFDKWIHIL